jgi:hypothetical protein
MLVAVVLMLGTGLVLWLCMLGQSIREEQAKEVSRDNLRQIGLAMHRYNAKYNRLPPAVVYSRKGKPLYGWRVLLLPFLGENDLYEQFHFDEPWDSPHNSTLLARRPKVYAPPLSNDPTHTHYLTFNSPHCAFDSGSDKELLQPFDHVPDRARGQVFEGGLPSAIPRTFIDGTSNTILVAEATEGVPWTKPVDLRYAADQPLPPLGGLYSDDSLYLITADAVVHSLHRQKLSEDTLRQAIITDDRSAFGNKLPDAAISILENPDHMELWSLKPEYAGPDNSIDFHGY